MQGTTLHGAHHTWPESLVRLEDFLGRFGVFVALYRFVLALFVLALLFWPPTGVPR